MVVEKFILELEIQLLERNVHIRLDDQAKAWLAERGYDRQFGARLLSRVIQEHIKKPLADELLFKRLTKGGEVIVHIKKDKPVFEITPAQKGPKKIPTAKKKALTYTKKS